MEFGPPKINEVFDMQGKKKYFHPQEKKHVAFRMLHSVYCWSIFLHIILSFLRHLKIAVSTKYLYYGIIVSAETILF